MVPFSNAADYLAALPNATLVALPGVGHIPQEEAPAAIGTLRAFLRGGPDDTAARARQTVSKSAP